MLTCYIPESKGKSESEKKPSIGLDFGIKTTITTSDGEKFEITVREPERLKGLQKKLARQKKQYEVTSDLQSRGFGNTMV